MKRGFWNVKRHAKAAQTLQNAETRMVFVTFNMEIMEFVNHVIVRLWDLGPMILVLIVDLLKKMGLLNAKRHVRHVQAPQSAAKQRVFVILITKTMDFVSHALILGMRDVTAEASRTYKERMNANFNVVTVR